MLYVTTRTEQESYTSLRALGENLGPDGGRYLPVFFPHYSQGQILALQEKTFAQIVAEVLNAFFSARLEERDVDFCVGRLPMRLISMSCRALVAEPWHNPDWSISRIVRNLTSRMTGTQYQRGKPSEWAQIAVRIAVLFGIFGELLRGGKVYWNKPVDLAMAAGDFSTPMAAWYAKRMGLPIGEIICSCNANGALWELLHRGEVKTGALSVKTNTPRGDIACPGCLERLIYDCFGTAEARRFSETMYAGGIYGLMPEQAMKLGKTMHTAVISDGRVESLISTVYQTGTYVLSPYSALAYGGLLDYRARTGSVRTAVIFTEESPICCKETVCKAMGISETELRERLNIK